MSLAILLGTFFLLLAGGLPIAFSLGLASLAYMLFFMPSVSLTVLPQHIFAGADSFTLTAIPFFVLMGELMNTGGIAQRLVRFTHTLVGHLRGGVGLVELVASMIFASFSGSAVANAVATGSVTIPNMIRAGYRPALAAAIEGSADSLGAIIPPSIPMIVYGTLAGVSVGALFVGGYAPGLIFGLGLALVIRARAGALGATAQRRPSPRDMFQALKQSALALLTPIIVMGGILGGVMTPTEAGAVGALYTLVVALLVYRELSWRDLPKVLLNTAVTTGVAMLVMTVANAFSWIMAYEMIPTRVADTVLTSIQQPWLLMLAIVALLLIVGTFIDTISALVILTPVLVPLASQMGIDPLFLGVIVTISLTLGVLTPPVGVVLFVTASMAKTTIEATTRELLPFLAVLIGATVLLALLPQVVLWLPRLLGFQ